MDSPPPSPLADFLGIQPQELEAASGDSPNLIFQTNEKYDPRIDLRTDKVLVHQHGQPLEDIAPDMKSWEAQGYQVLRMFFASSDAGQFFELGHGDLTPHPGAQETEADGKVLRCDNTRAYTFPTPDWCAYQKTFIDHALANGAAGVSPEEPFAHATAGYEQAYRDAFSSAKGKPWIAPHTSTSTYWEACQFKSDQFYNLVKELSTYTHQQAAAQDLQVQYILPIHSILSNMAGGRIFPNVRSIGLQNVNAWIGQVWTGPVHWAMGDMGGERFDGFFESALALYSTFAELSRNVPDKKMYLLVDPVEDDPRYSWDTYRERYEMCVAAMLQYPWIDHYEVMPWPDRIFLPTFTMGGGSPGPSDYLTELMAVLAVQRDMPNYPTTMPEAHSWLGMFISDSASWEMHGPGSLGFGPFHGLYLPLASQGALVRTPWLERAAEPGYLDPYKVLLLTYDNQKPVSPKIHDGLLEWVRAGGQLVLVGGRSAYNDVPGWWREQGYDSPQQALLAQAGLQVKQDQPVNVTTLNFNGGSTICPKNLEALSFSAPGEIKPIATAQDGQLVCFSATVDKGNLTVLGMPADWASQDPEASVIIRQIVMASASRAGVSFEASPCVQIKRGPYVAGYVNDGEQRWSGSYVDLFDPSYPLLKDPVKTKRQSVLFKQVEAQPGPEPALLFATHKLIFSRTRPDQLELVMEGPADTLAAVRVLAPAGRTRTASATAMDSRGNAVPVLTKFDPDSHSCLVQFPYDPHGVAVRVTWDAAKETVLR